MVQREYGPGGVQEHMLEELQLYCVYKPGHQDGGSGCLLWFNDLIDTRTFLQNEQDIFIQMDASELGMNLSSTRKVTLVFFN
jgi:hypothetical protein